MFKKTSIAVSCLAVALAFGSSAFAAGPSGIARNLRSTPAVSFIVASKRTAAPFAHVRFCLDNPGQCVGGGAEMIELNAERQAELTRINDKVNRAIRPVNDNASVAGGDVWSLDVAEGDCDDYAVTKREKLLAAGWSPSALRIAVARTGSGEGHAVLVVKTDKGDLVLDNRSNRIKSWRFTDLRILKIQSGENPRQWYTL